MYMCDSSETFLELIGLYYHFHPFEGQKNIIFQTPITDTFHGETNFVCSEESLLVLFVKWPIQGFFFAREI